MTSNEELSFTQHLNDSALVVLVIAQLDQMLYKVSVFRTKIHQNQYCKFADIEVIIEVWPLQD
jgi:hypothetical protein